ncbi:MAG: hypothetical protein EBS61_09280 [Betaproteobacteria bacterium]|nr:hypothetical protein [Betaproteobacteria bacterium]
MAEQEILMLCCKDDQLLDLHLAFPEGSLPSYFLTPFINDRSAQFSTRRDLIRAILDNQFGLYKIVGSFKPWQDDFHDLVKLPYQERARDLYMSIPSLDPQSFAAFRRFTQKEVGGKPISQIMRLNLESDFYRSIAEELTR